MVQAVLEARNCLGAAEKVDVKPLDRDTPAQMEIASTVYRSCGPPPDLVLELVALADTLPDARHDATVIDVSYQCDLGRSTPHPRLIRERSSVVARCAVRA